MKHLKSLESTDPEVFELLRKEKKRQSETLQMIPSENYVSTAVLQAVGSALINKYSEGYPGKRYYQGSVYIDQIESIAVQRAKEIFGVPYINIQPYSGSPANYEVLFALLEPGDTIMGMALSFGGHLTHGHPKVSFSGKFFSSVQYTLDTQGFLDYTEIETLAIKHKPKIIISGATAYPREINFKKFGEIADKVGAWHMADISHISGLIAGGVHVSPVDYCHIVTTTTHKTLRGPRGAMIMVTEKGLAKDPNLDSKIDKAVFPGMQGGPHNNTTAGIAVCLKEAQEAGFRDYVQQVVKNSRVLALELKKCGFEMVSGGTDNHLILINLANKNIDGWCAAWSLEYAGIVVNRNSVPYEKNSPFYPSGIRVGTPSITTRGMKEKDMVTISHWINDVINRAVELLPKSFENKNNGDKEAQRSLRFEFKKRVQNDKFLKDINSQVKFFCKSFPVT